MTVEIPTTDSTPTVLALPESEDPPTFAQVSVVEALRQVSTAVAALDTAIGATVEGLTQADHLGVLYLLSAVREERERLHRLESTCERTAAQLMPVDQVEAPDLLAIRRRGSTRRAWDNETMRGRVEHYAVTQFAFDKDGTMDDVLAEVAKASVATAFAAGTPSWKVTGLRQMGIRYDDCCETIPGRASVQVLRGAEATAALVEGSTGTDA